MTPFRLLFVAMIATVLLIGARSGAEAQFPRGLLAAAPRVPNEPSCTIETRPLSFGTYDPEANANLDAVAQVIFTCDAQAKKIRIECHRNLEHSIARCQMEAIACPTTLLDATHRTVR